MQQPIHMISRRGTVYHIYRGKRLDAQIAAEFMQFREMDKGPLPYFSDLKNPSMYVDGRRYEGSFGSSDPESEEEKYLLGVGHTENGWTEKANSSLKAEDGCVINGRLSIVRAEDHRLEFRHPNALR